MEDYMTAKKWGYGILFSLLFVAGLSLAGAEGDWFPWINLLGLHLMAGAAMTARLLEGKD
jgi:hypothetical protein